MSTVRCFLLVATDRHRVKLRRYAPSDARPCPSRGSWGCDAAAPVGEVYSAEHPPNGDDPARYPHDDPRWPTACAHCGGAFVEGDAWQVFHECVYVRADGAAGEHYLRSLPPGAMYDATWLHGNAEMCGPDGRSFILRLPDGREWAMDGPSTNGNGWTRTGEAPRFTARPSILTPAYHGFLTDGELVSC